MNKTLQLDCETQLQTLGAGSLRPARNHPPYGEPQPNPSLLEQSKVPDPLGRNPDDCVLHHRLFLQSGLERHFAIIVLPASHHSRSVYRVSGLLDSNPSRSNEDILL